MIGINDWIKDLEAAFNAARQSHDIAKILHLADRIINQIDQRREAEIVTDDDHAQCLKTIKRMAYNAAADAWPAWSETASVRTHEELTHAVKLAERSWACVQQLNQSPMQVGNAVWLIGALRLAQNDRTAAYAHFAQAASEYEQAGARAMQLMAEGYCAITLNPAGLDIILEKLAVCAEPHSAELAGQLRIAHRIFNR
jgi:hypothetical protein